MRCAGGGDMQDVNLNVGLNRELGLGVRGMLGAPLTYSTGFNVSSSKRQTADKTRLSQLCLASEQYQKSRSPTRSP